MPVVKRCSNAFVGTVAVSSLTSHPDGILTNHKLF